MDCVIEASGHGIDRRLELGILKRERPPAVCAQQVVVMIGAVRQGGLVTSGGAATDVQPPHETQILERLKGPIDGRYAHRAPAGPQALGDLVGGEHALLAPDQPEHGRARDARAVARRAQLALGQLDPRRRGW